MNRTNRNTACLLVGMTVIAISAGCGGNENAGASRPNSGETGSVSSRHETPVVYTVNYPLQYFAERIGGDAVTVIFPEIDEDPAYWTPGPEIVTQFQSADLILLNGAGYADWTTKVSLPSSRLVDTSERVRDRLIERDDLLTHTHGPEGEHAHGRMAFTIWMDPVMAIEQARSIETAFSQTWPEHANDFERGLAALEADLKSLDAHLDSIAARINEPVVMSHPVYQYLERRYDLDARSVHFEPDIMPDDSMMSDLRALLEEHPAGWMIWEAKPIPESVQRLDALGLQSVVVDPCANRPEEGDFLECMRRNASSLARITARQ